MTVLAICDWLLIELETVVGGRWRKLLEVLVDGER